MARSYRHIQQYEKEILEMKAQGISVREIGERFGLTYEQVHGFFKRHNQKQRKIEAGIALRKKGRPPKDANYTEADKINELKYIIDRKNPEYSTTKINIAEMMIALIKTTIFFMQRSP